MKKNIIPNAFTMGNLFLGFLSILFSAQSDYQHAAICILIAMMLDSLDGRVARMLNATSDFGKELDSLADIVSFGVAPAMMMYYVSLQEWGMWGMALAGLFPLFGAFRLARFNVQAEKNGLDYFTGVPITAAGGLLTLVTLLHDRLPNTILYAIFLLLCLLMVSTLKIPSLKEVPLPKYGTIITLLIGYIVYLFSKGTYEESPHFVYLAIIVYVLFLGYQFRKKQRK